MGLDFGWKFNDVRDTIWKDDDSLQNVPEGALEDWKRDGDASHLLPFATNGQPHVFTFRALTLDESRHVLGLNVEGEVGDYLRQILACFRIGVAFQAASEEFKNDSTGQRGLMRTVRERGIRMLAEPFVSALEQKYPGIIGFYGTKIYQATFPSEPEKKASSPSSTKTPSSEVASTKDDTAGPDKAAAAVA